MDAGTVLGLTLVGCFIAALIISLIVTFIIRGVTKPPKCLKDTPWKIYGIRSDYFKRIDKNSAKVKLELKLEDHANTYYRTIKVTINYIGNLSIPNPRWGGYDNFEDWEIVKDDNITTDAHLYYNGYYWKYDDTKLVGIRYGG